MSELLPAKRNLRFFHRAIEQFSKAENHFGAFKECRLTWFSAAHSIKGAVHLVLEANVIAFISFDPFGGCSRENSVAPWHCHRSLQTSLRTAPFLGSDAL